MIRASSKDPLPVDINVLSGHFKATLSDALSRACACLEGVRQERRRSEDESMKSKSMLADTSAD